MLKTELMQALRDRQCKPGSVPEDLIDVLSDDDIIESSITCSDCGAKLLDLSWLDIITAEAEDVDDFPDAPGMHAH